MKSSPGRFRRHILPVLIAFAAAFGVMRTDFGQRIENVTLDLRTRLRARLHPTPPSEEVLLVGIDEPSLRQLGRWPWDRATHGNLLQLLSLVEPNGPTAVGWDLLFPEASPQDADFAEGIKLSQIDVVLAAERGSLLYGVTPDSPAAKAARLEALPHIEGDRSRITHDAAMVLPAGDLAKIAAVGFVDSPPDPDGVRRTLPLMVRIGEHVYPTLSLQILLRHWHAKPQQVRVVLGREITVETPGKLWRIPIDEQGRFFINYRHSVQGIRSAGYAELMAALHQRYVQEKPAPLPPIANRVLLVGQVADGLSDLGPTPFSALTPLVLVHVNTIENVLREDFVHLVPLAPVWLGALLVAIAGAIFLSERSMIWLGTFSLGTPLVYVLAATGLWVSSSVLLPLVGPLAGFFCVQAYIMGRRVLVEQKAKEQIKGAFGAYLSPALVDRLAASGAMPQLGGHEEEITAYFSDIQNYSTFSEKLPAEQLVELLNEYLTACTDTITEEGGTLDKYIGDAVVAMFGAPLPLPDHGYRACVSALRVQQQLGVLRARWNQEADRWPETVLKMQSRIGLNSGPAVIGNMGSRTRFNYTMTGDNVNLAARMESGAKHWGVYTMCTEATKLACEQHGGDRVVFRPLSRLIVMGRTQPVPVFEVVALKENLTDATRECLAMFARGLEKYYARDWHGALAEFERSAAIEPNQPGKTPGVKLNPSLVYMDIARHYMVEPPPPNWQGEYRMTEK